MAQSIIHNSETTGHVDSAAPQVAGARPVPARAHVSAEQIRDRAYFIFLARNGEPGSPEADWTRAELELRAEASKRSPASAPDRVQDRSQIVEPRAAAGVAAASPVGSRRSPVLFSGG
jgi:hypothetical protein